MPRLALCALTVALACIVGLKTSVAADATAKKPLSIRLVEEGITIESGSTGSFTLGYPVLVGERWDQVRKPIEKSVAGNTAIIKFDGGARVEVTLQADTLTLTPANIPADVKSIRQEMLIDFSFANGGAYQMGSGSETPFPTEKPAKPHLYQDHATSFLLRSPQGAAVSFALPQYSFLQLTDCREWNWKTFNWQISIPYNAEAGPLKLKISCGRPGATSSDSPQPAKLKPLMDRFGQNTRVESVDKVSSEAELKQDLQKEADYLASLHPPAADPFGGQTGSREKLELKQTGFFHVEKKAGRWVLVDPDGNAFFHLGICAMNPSDDFTYIAGREQVYEWLPSHDGDFKSAFHPNEYWNPTSLSFHLVNSIRKYGQPYDPAKYTTRMIERARKWGFNSGGAFGSGDSQARKQASFPAVAHLPLSQWEGLDPLPGVHEAFDPFDEKNRVQCDKNFAKTIADQANDPLIIGYFLVNEPLYEDLPRVIPSLSSRFACKRRLAQMLEEKYKAVAEFNRVWETTFNSFADVAASGLPVKTRAAAADIQAFTGLFLETYFQLVADTFHKYDKNHLLIGNRLQAGTINNEQLCRISGKYLDVISFNYYTYSVDKEFLNRIHKWTGDRPMILSEFYYSSPKDSGLPGGVKDVSSQLERGLAYRNYVEQAASLSYIVGIEWFTLIDQSLTGRYFDKFNGENANTGLIAVTDRPWKITLAEMMKSNYDIYKVVSGERAPFAFDDPRFTSSGVGHKVAKIARATGPIQINGQSRNWPGTPAEIIASSRLVQGSDAGGLEASFKLCWDDDNLYLLAHVADATPMKNDQKGDMLWSGDGLELFIGCEEVDQAGPLLFSDRQILLGATRQGEYHFVNVATQPRCETSVTEDVDGKGYTLEGVIPFKALGFVPKEGRTILFDLAVDDSAGGKARLRQLVWNGTARNSGDRSGWARAEFSK